MRVELDKSSPIPLYYQLVEQIREQIRRGDLRPGDRLPPERVLSEQHGISRMTARQAIGYLVRDGVLSVRHGLGTFVAEPKLTHDALHLLGFSEEARQVGSVVASRVLEQSLVVPPARVAAALGLAEGAQVVKIIRLRLAGDEPLLLETVYIPGRYTPGLEHEDLASQSLYALLEQRYGLGLQGARQTLEATVANEYESRLFGVAAGVPMILIEGVVDDAEGRAIEYFKAVYRGDRFKFIFESQRAPGAGSPPDRTRVSLVLA